MTPSLAPETQFLRGPIYLFLALALLAMYLGVLPTGIIGVGCLLLPLAFVLEPLGERLPVLKDYLGGSPLLLVFLGAGLAHFGILPANVVKSFNAFMKESGTNFLDFFICSLITGAILGIHSKMLLKAGLRYGAPVLGGVVVSCALLALVGLAAGRGWKELVLNIARIVPAYIISACYSWFRFVVKAFVGVVLLAIGVVFTDLGEVIRSITPYYVLLCATVVVGASIGAGLVGRMVGLYFVESAITAGLCMTNMGGTGDVAVLSASKRMQLMPFARISTSIGGALIIVLCGLLASYIHHSQ